MMLSLNVNALPGEQDRDSAANKSESGLNRGIMAKVCRDDEPDSTSQQDIDTEYDLSICFASPILKIFSTLNQDVESQHF